MKTDGLDTLSPHTRIAHIRSEPDRTPSIASSPRATPTHGVKTSQYPVDAAAPLQVPSRERKRKRNPRGRKGRNPSYHFHLKSWVALYVSSLFFIGSMPSESRPHEGNCLFFLLQYCRSYFCLRRRQCGHSRRSPSLERRRPHDSQYPAFRCRSCHRR